MRHEPWSGRTPRRSLIARRRFQFAGALVLAALLPCVVRAADDPRHDVRRRRASTRCIGNAAAVLHRLLDAAVDRDLSRHPLELRHLPGGARCPRHGDRLCFLLTRLPYDRLALPLGFVLHVLWNYAVYFFGERRIRPRIAIVPFGGVDALTAIEQVDWRSAEARPGSTTRPGAARSSPISPPTCPTSGKRSWPTPRWPGGSSTRSSNCRNR